MDRRMFLARMGTAVAVAASAPLVGCRGRQYGHVIQDGQSDLVGSHSAGAEVFNPLIDEAVGQLLARQTATFQPAGFDPQGVPGPKTICFIGVENKSAEELGDFKDQIYQQIDTQIVQSQTFQPVSKRMIDAGLRESRLRPDALLLPDNMRLFTEILQRQGQPLDYLLYATITSGTTDRNNSQQRDYVLTMELVNVHSGAYDKQSAKISKGYHKTRAGKLWHYNPLQSQG